VCSICRYIIITEEREYREEVESVYFMDHFNSCRGREKIIKEADRKWRDLMREGGNRKKDRNNCIWVLTRDNSSDKSKSARWNKSQKEGEWCVVEIGGLRYLEFVRIIMIVMIRTRRRDVNFLDEFYA